MGDKSVMGAAPPRVWGRQPTGDPHARTVAVLAPGYGLERVSYMIPSARRRYVKLSRLPWHRLERRGSFWAETVPVVGPRVDLVHTFNQIALNRPFGVTVEMELPRYLGAPARWQRQLGLRLLRSDHCRGIWPLSEAARAYLLRRFAAAGLPELAHKVTVFRGAVTPPPPGADRAGYAESGPLRLLFVGGDGLRKGLGPALAAAERLRAGGVEATVTVVGAATAETYLVPGERFPTAPVEALLARPWVTHHRQLPNAAVRALMGAHDLFLFPTMDESLGWVPAEAAMSGTPTIATDIFALPELVVDGATGWTLPVDKDVDGRWRHIGQPHPRDAWQAAQEALTDGLVAILAGARREEIAARGRQARAHITALYGMDVAGAALDELYERAIVRT